MFNLIAGREGVKKAPSGREAIVVAFPQAEKEGKLKLFVAWVGLMARAPHKLNKVRTVQSLLHQTRDHSLFMN